MSRRARSFEQYKRATIAETTQAILNAHSREVKSDGHTWIKRDPQKPQRGQKFATDYVEKVVDGEKKMVPVTHIRTCSSPMNPAKAQRIAATLHKTRSN